MRGRKQHSLQPAAGGVKKERVAIKRILRLSGYTTVNRSTGCRGGGQAVVFWRRGQRAATNLKIPVCLPADKCSVLLAFWGQAAAGGVRREGIGSAVRRRAGAGFSDVPDR